MILAANLKCNHTRKSFLQYSKSLNEYLLQSKNINDIIVFPPAMAFAYDINSFTQGAQNFYPCQNGSFTGEIGKDMLDEFGIDTVLIGHSERRMLGESEELLKSKFNFAVSYGMKIIYCVGESLDDYNARKSLDIIEAQIKNIDLKYENLVVAYEPIYSIGSGVSARNVDIEKILNKISKYTDAPLIYGGSVNKNNIAKILSLKNCNGVLIGTASWDIDNFIELIEMVN